MRTKGESPAPITPPAPPNPRIFRRKRRFEISEASRLIGSKERDKRAEPQPARERLSSRGRGAGQQKTDPPQPFGPGRAIPHAHFSAAQAEPCRADECRELLLPQTDGR